MLYAEDWQDKLLHGDSRAILPLLPDSSMDLMNPSRRIAPCLRGG